MPSPTRGSQFWLRQAVNLRTPLINTALCAAMGVPASTPVQWHSPLPPGYEEYRDMAALRHLGCQTPKRELADYWPARGPVWDALATVGGSEMVLVEAKAHIPEAASPGTKAGPASRQTIERALDEARRYWAPRAKAAWTETFYQYANRLAMLYFLRVVNRQPAHLAFVYFLNAKDVQGPASSEEWIGAIRLLHSALGVSESRIRPYVHDVFLDVADLA